MKFMTKRTKIFTELAGPVLSSIMVTMHLIPGFSTVISVQVTEQSSYSISHLLDTVTTR